MRNCIKLCSACREEEINFFSQIPILNKHVINRHMHLIVRIIIKLYIMWVWQVKP